MVRVKICGITSLEDAMTAVEAGADALGFIFVEETPRFVTPERVAPIVAALPPFVTPVGVFWDHPARSEEHTSELQSRLHLVCRLLLEKKKNNSQHSTSETGEHRRS